MIRDYLLITEDPNEAELLLKAIRDEMGGYVFILTEEEKLGYPFEMKVSSCIREGKI